MLVHVDGTTDGEVAATYTVPFFFDSIFLKENYRVILSLVLGFTPVWASCSMSYQAIVVSFCLFVCILRLRKITIFYII